MKHYLNIDDNREMSSVEHSIGDNDQRYENSKPCAGNPGLVVHIHLQQVLSESYHPGIKYLPVLSKSKGVMWS